MLDFRATIPDASCRFSPNSRGPGIYEASRGDAETQREANGQMQTRRCKQGQALRSGLLRNAFIAWVLR